MAGGGIGAFAGKTAVLLPATKHHTVPGTNSPHPHPNLFRNGDSLPGDNNIVIPIYWHGLKLLQTFWTRVTDHHLENIITGPLHRPRWLQNWSKCQ